MHAALTNLESRPAPAGVMTVVLGSGWPGILLHEAIGHGLEGDFNRKGSSAFSGRIGQRVAAKGVTVLDDGTIADRRGSLNIDDEGVPSQRNVLIEDGILKGYIQDSMNVADILDAQVGANVDPTKISGCLGEDLKKALTWISNTGSALGGYTGGIERLTGNTGRVDFGFDFGFDRLKDRISCERGRNEDHRSIGFGTILSFLHRVEDRKVEDSFLSAFTRSHPGNKLGAVCE